MPDPLANLDQLEANAMAALNTLDQARAILPASDQTLSLVLDAARACIVSALALAEDFRGSAADAAEAKAECDRLRHDVERMQALVAESNANTERVMAEIRAIEARLSGPGAAPA